MTASSSPPSASMNTFGHTRVLCLGLSDPSAGTGVQADLKTLLSLGIYGCTVVTTVTAQNARGTQHALPLPADIVTAQFDSVVADHTPRVIKTGFLGNASIMDHLADRLERASSYASIVIDPVMTNRAGQILMTKNDMDSLKRVVMLRADVTTPNIIEAETLTGLSIRDPDQMRHGAEMIRTLGAKSVILKGGDLGGDRVYDVLSDEQGTDIFEFPRLSRALTRGAGTTLSAALAAALAKGYTVRESYMKVRRFLQAAIETGIVEEAGSGPVNHVSLIEQGTMKLL